MKTQSFRITEASEWLGIHVETLREWCNRGAVPCYRTPGNRFYFTLDLLEQIRGQMLTAGRGNRK